MKRFFVLATVFFSIASFAQDSTNINFGIITKKTFGLLRIDGNKISQKMLKQEIYKVPAAIPLYKQALRVRNAALKPSY